MAIPIEKLFHTLNVGGVSKRHKKAYSKMAGPRMGRIKDRDIDRLGEYFDKMPEFKQELFEKYYDQYMLRKGISPDDRDHPFNEADNEYVMGDLEGRINRITHKLIMKGEGVVGTRDRAFIREWIDFFLPNHTTHHKIKSTWLISASYVKKSEQMKVLMKRGTGEYTFYRVPAEVWLYLTTLPSSAGTWWWENWIWHYSANKQRFGWDTQTRFSKFYKRVGTPTPSKSKANTKPKNNSKIKKVSKRKK